MENIFLYIFLIGTGFEFLLNIILENICHLARYRNGSKVPDQLKDFVDEEKIRATCSYKNDRFKLWLPSFVIMTVVELFTVIWLYPYCFNLAWNWTGNAYLTVMLLVVLSSIPAEIISIPFSLIREFVIEKKHGFSKMTFKMWLGDQLKSLLLSAVMGAGLLSFAVLLLLKASSWWWILLGAGYLIVSLVISYVYPIWIAPIFNKFTPLESGELRDRLESLLEKTGFKSNGIFVMDASKRSSHSNAYFTGFGKNKRIVLYDTLIQQLSPEEIEAVLAHELGHYKKHHITRRMVVTVPVVFAALYLLSLLISLDQVYTSFGVVLKCVEEENPLTYIGRTAVVPESMAHFVASYKFLGLMLVASCFSGFSPLLELITAASSRRDEYQADSYSAELCGTGKPLCTALIKLNKENLSEFTPPKIYWIFNYDHPPLLERIRHVLKEGEQL